MADGTASASEAPPWFRLTAAGRGVFLLCFADCCCADCNGGPFCILACFTPALVKKTFTFTYLFSIFCAV